VVLQGIWTLRARNIKPAIWSNEILAECEPLARLLFIGLWNCADRQGRLEDRPKRIKALVLPYDNCDIEKLLCDLGSKGFIHRYTVNDKQYILIPAFVKHQSPHRNEVESKIPLPTPVLATKDKSTSDQGSSHFALNPERGILNPERGKRKQESEIRGTLHAAIPGANDDVDEEWITEIGEEYPELDLLHAARGMRDEYVARPGRYGKRRSIRRSFRNWLGNTRKFQKRDAALTGKKPKADISHFHVIGEAK
jgi:hypothetical protein